MRKIYLSLLAVLIAAMPLLAGTNGGLAGAFTRIGAGARAKAMGNAYTGLAEGPSAVYFNPAAISFHTDREFSATLTDMALDRRLDYLAFTAPVHPKPKSGQLAVKAGIGVGWLHAGVGDIDARDFDGNPLDLIDQSSNLFTLSFGVQPHPKLGIGLNAKVIYETFGKIGGNNDRSINGDGVGLDVGVFSKPIEHLSVGVLVKDIAAKTTWNTNDYWSQGSSKADDWPMQYRVGTAYQLGGFTGALDFETSETSDSQLHMGVELKPEISDRHGIAIRMGYEGKRRGNMSVGMGYGLAIRNFWSWFDFAYTFEDIAPDDAFVVGWNVTF